MRAVVVGAGIGGLVAARLLAQRGLEVVVLEAHTYPGGLAGSFPHRGVLLEAGATLLSGFAPGGPMRLLEEALGLRFPADPLLEGFPLMAVHLPEGVLLRPVGREAERAAQEDFFGKGVLPFWDWQAERAEALWALAPRLPFPPEDPRDLSRLLRLAPGFLSLLPDLFRKAQDLAPKDPRFLRFLDAQLLIAAQCGVGEAYALYAAAALDLPHRGAVLPRGGMGATPGP